MICYLLIRTQNTLSYSSSIHKKIIVIKKCFFSSYDFTSPQTFHWITNLRLLLILFRLFHHITLQWFPSIYITAIILIILIDIYVFLHKLIVFTQTKYDDIRFQLILIWLGIVATKRRISGCRLSEGWSSSELFPKTWRNLAMLGSASSLQWRCNRGTLDKTLPFWTSKPSGLRNLYGFPVVGSISARAICFHRLCTNQPYL